MRYSLKYISDYKYIYIVFIYSMYAYNLSYIEFSVNTKIFPVLDREYSFGICLEYIPRSDYRIQPQIHKH